MTVSDLLRISRELMAGTPVKDVMTQHVLVAHSDESLFVALETMTNHGVGRLPVVSKDSGKLMGIITRTDVIRAYERAVDLLSKSEPT